jgi:hypothetical protein
MAICNNAFMYSRHYLSDHDLEVLHTQTVQTIESMLVLREEQRRLKAQIAVLETPTLDKTGRPSIRRTAHVSLFVMMPFGENFNILEGALRQVFEDDPYYFQVILARDRTIHPNLFENIKAHMRMVYGFVGDVSDLHPNVLLELGITEADTEERPVIILRRRESQEPPADLKGRLYIEYDLPSKREVQPEEQLAAQLRGKLQDIEAVEQLLKNRMVRYLSVTHLQRKFGRNRLAREEAEKLSKAFPTIDELEVADKATIKHKTGLDDIVVAMVEAAF